MLFPSLSRWACSLHICANRHLVWNARETKLLFIASVQPKDQGFEHSGECDKRSRSTEPSVCAHVVTKTLPAFLLSFSTAHTHTNTHVIARHYYFSLSSVLPNPVLQCSLGRANHHQVWCLERKLLLQFVRSEIQGEVKSKYLCWAVPAKTVLAKWSLNLANPGTVFNT